MTFLRTLLAFSIFLIQTFSLQSQIFVNSSANGTNDGSSWENAYSGLHEALENYEENDDIWVAAGTYLPGESSAWGVNPRITFYIHENVKLYGGFNGTETALEERNPSTNITVLSGDINLDDINGDFLTNRTDNVTEVIYIENNIENSTVVDGFSIVNGHASGNGNDPGNQRGGGVWTLGSPLMNNCYFSQNYAFLYGGAFYARNEDSSDSRVENCVFEQNMAEIGGGGITASTESATETIQISDCDFIQNDSQGYGAGVYIFDSSAALIGCAFEGNTSIISGGAVFMSLLDQDACTLANCSFTNNISSNGGACAVQGTGSYTSASIDIILCDFTDNQAAVVADDNLNDGGAIFIEILSEGAQDNVINVVDCFFEGNTARVGGGINSIHFAGTNNTLNINRCIYRNNLAADGGGIQVWELGGSSIFTSVQNTEFDGNTGNFFQAIAQRTDASGTDCEMEVVNCLFHQNGSAELEKSVLACEGEMSVRNCTFSANESSAINLRDQGVLSLQNTILDGVDLPNIVVNIPADATLNSNGGTISNDDSLNDWLNALDQSETQAIFQPGTFMLTEESPGVDEGVLFDNNPIVDFLGNERVQGGCIDIGAIESSFSTTNECMVSVSEFNAAQTILGIFPNPVSGAAHLSIENNWKGDIQLSIVNVLGQEVYSKMIQKNTVNQIISLELHDLPSSTYYLMISNQNAIAKEAFLKL